MEKFVYIKDCSKLNSISNISVSQTKTPNKTTNLWPYVLIIIFIMMFIVFKIYKDLQSRQAKLHQYFYHLQKNQSIKLTIKITQLQRAYEQEKNQTIYLKEQLASLQKIFENSKIEIEGIDNRLEQIQKDRKQQKRQTLISKQKLASLQKANSTLEGINKKLTQIQKGWNQEQKQTLFFKEKIKSLQQIDRKVSNEIQAINKCLTQSKSQVHQMNKTILPIQLMIQSIQKQNQKNDIQIKRLNFSLAQIQSQTNLGKKAVFSMKKQMETFSSQIDQLHRNELSKQEKGMQFFQRFSKRYRLVISKKISSIKTHYIFNQEKGSITKLTNEINQAFLYPTSSIPDDSVYYFQVKIERTQLGMISIGVFTHNKKMNELDCGYCGGNQMYYIHGNNGRVYHGKDLKIFNKYKDSRFENFKSGDTVTVFIDRNLQHITWYINGRYAQSKFLQYSFAKQQLYPFILIAEKNDEVIIRE